MQPDSNKPLALSDIMHTLSPSPGPPPPEEQTEVVSEDGSTEKYEEHPEARERHDPLTQDEVQTMQARLEEIGLFALQPSTSTSISPTNHTPLELELGVMVSRLLSQHRHISPRDLSEQLISQAETIASLTVQRDFLLRQYTDARASWEVECQGWERSSEALIRQRSAAAAATKDEISGRLIARLENENKRLRNKIAELRNRLISVETELYKLRPLLLVPPVHPEPSRRTKSALRPTLSRHSVTEAAGQSIHTSEDTSKQSVAVADTPILSEAVTDIPDTVQPSASQTTEPDKSSSESQTLSSQATLPTLPSLDELQLPSELPPPRPHSYYRTAREREMDLAIPSHRKSRTPVSTPGPSSLQPLSSTAQVLNPSWVPQTRADQRAAVALLSDARAELMLYAARKIGKKRVGSLAGLVVQPAESQRSVQDQFGGKGKGKERAGSRALSDKGKGRETEERDEAAPAKKQRKKTAKKATTMPKPPHGTAANPTAGGFYGSLPHLVYVNPVHAGQHMGSVPMQMTSGAPGAMPLFVPMSSVWPPMVPSGGATPLSSSSPSTSKAQGKQPAEQATPIRPTSTQPATQTPTLGRTESAAASQGLDSLLSAARLLADDEGLEPSGIATPTQTHSSAPSPQRTRRTADTLEAVTPTPKRRKVASGTPGSVSVMRPENR